MCFAIARVFKAFLAFFAYFLSFVSAGTIYASLTGSLPYAGPVCTLAFLIVWYNRNAFAQMIRRAPPGNASVPNAWHRYLLIGTAWVICMQLFYAYRVPRPGVSTANTLWTILGAWFLFFCGALITSSEANEQFERVLPVRARSASATKTISLVECLAFPMSLRRQLAEVARTKTHVEESVHTTPWLEVRNMTTSCAMHRSGIKTLQAAHGAKTSMPIIATSAFVATFAATAMLYVDGKISDEEWRDYALHYGTTPLDILNRTMLSGFEIADYSLIYALVPLDETHDSVYQRSVDEDNQIQMLFFICIEHLVRACVNLNKKIFLINAAVDAQRDSYDAADALMKSIVDQAPQRCDVVGGLFSETPLKMSSQQAERWRAVCKEFCGTLYVSPNDAYVGLCKAYNKSIDRKANNKKPRNRK